MKEVKHTQTPWQLYVGGNFICIATPEWVAERESVGHIAGSLAQVTTRFDQDVEERLPDAEFIVLAVNHHDQLVEALDALLSLGRKDTSNPKYDSYYEAAHAVLVKLKGAK